MNAGRNATAVVVTYFTGPVLERAIDALRRQPEIIQIVIVDNGNWPGALERWSSGEASEGCVEIITGHGNVGFSKACNMGARTARGEWLVFVNPDAVMPDGGVAQLIDASIRLSGPTLMGAMLIDPDGVEQRGSRRRALTPRSAFIEMTKLYMLAPNHPYFQRFNLHTEPTPDDVVAIPVISGACFLLRKSDYFSVGGMDEQYFLHVEDVDFCLRFAKAGGGVYFNPHVRVVHYKGSSRVSAIQVEMRKTRSINRFFRAHFWNIYPAPFLSLVAGFLWVSFVVKATTRAIVRIPAIISLRMRKGRRGLQRAARLFGRRSSR